MVLSQPAAHRARAFARLGRSARTTSSAWDHCMVNWVIREEQSCDRQAVRSVNELAFGQTVEADLVEQLHRLAAVAASLVAEAAGEVVGHILFSPVHVEHGGAKRIAGLAPMAVAPRPQRQGIGSLLVRHGLESCARMGYDAVVVLGHPHYYPRFGFAPAGHFGLRCEYDVPPEVFMALELPKCSLQGVSGLVRYHAAFAAA